jgi:hypothetical protein
LFLLHFNFSAASACPAFYTPSKEQQNRWRHKKRGNGRLWDDAPLRTRHQKEAIDRVVLNAFGWEGAGDATLVDGNAGLTYCRLSRRVRLHEASIQVLNAGLSAAIVQLAHTPSKETSQLGIGFYGNLLPGPLE